MRVVVDSNQLQTPQLETFLASGPAHRAVVTDWLMMEAYKGEMRKTLYKSIAVLEKYPRQVIVLRNTGQCMRVRAAAQMANRLIWTQHTETFPEFLREVRLAEAGDSAIEKSLLWRGREASARMDDLLSKAGLLMEGNMAMVSSLTAADIKAIRGNRIVPPDILSRVFGIAMDIAEAFRQSSEEPIPPPSMRMRNKDFLFRVGLGITCSCLEWVRTGSTESVKAEKVRNDYVDVMLSVYGTYFNGLMTADAKLTRIHWMHRQLLKAIGAVLPDPYPLK